MDRLSAEFTVFTAAPRSAVDNAAQLCPVSAQSLPDPVGAFTEYLQLSLKQHCHIIVFSKSPSVYDFFRQVYHIRSEEHTSELQSQR